MKSTTKRKIAGSLLKVASAAVAAGVPLIMLREIAPVWVKENGSGTAITGVGILAIVFAGAIILSKIKKLTSGFWSAVKKVKGVYMLCLVLIALVWIVCVGAQRLYPLTDDVITLCAGSAVSVGAGFGMDVAAEIIIPKEKNKEKENGENEQS